MPRDRLCERGRLLRASDPGPPEAGVAVDQHAELAARVRRRTGEAREQRRVVGGDRDPRPPEQLRELLELPPADEVVRDQHVVDPGVDHHLRLVQRLAGDARGAELDLPPRDLDALVRLHVRAVGETDAVAVLLPAREVRLEPVEVDDRGRRRDVEAHAAAHAGSSRAPVAASKTCASSTRGQSDTRRLALRRSPRLGSARRA